ncbi:MAG: rhodanese-like domain-containing protein [Betaproteobacteria bacterium]|jgi:rhodanese-related sulfurtransferase|nr:rhodanese-like domain-containing protein [Betaproteobacteria bacterium]MCH9849145.1 rhodanese-like domain-containing protein [Betaproteobacteria bacterium]MDG1097278.1 rhodanese-like domain-containing protein [Methylophilaceae bacterium]MDG1453966.1 rhodanese-like domain-containing protein [Methylophilaceae bacterium]
MTQTNFIKFILAILLAFSISACSTDVPTVSPNQAAQLFSDQQAVIVDVREQAEWDEQHIDGAIFIPLNQVENRMSELTQYKDSPIIVQCRSGRRSNIAGAKLIDAGFTKVYNLEGGILAWDKQGLETVQTATTTN